MNEERTIKDEKARKWENKKIYFHKQVFLNFRNRV